MKNKFFILLLLITINLFSRNITIKADLLRKNKDILILDKNIFISINKSTITGNKATCLLKKLKIINCSLTGNLKFIIFKKNILKYEGKADSLTYVSKNNIYTYSGNVVIEDMVNKNIIKGDKIKIDMNKNGSLEITGKKNQPVDINFNI